MASHRSQHTVLWVLLAVLAFGFLAAAMVAPTGFGGTDTRLPPGTAASAPPVPAATLGPTSQLLAALVVVDEPSRVGYDRDLFVHWSDFDGDGCHTRCEVLETQQRDGATGPEWLSVYDGVVTSDPSTFDVDHMVPLAEAYDSGAVFWNPTRREDFANDPAGLVAVSAFSNRSKSDQDPAQWRPEDTSSWCWYATVWVETKSRWELSVDSAERDALTDMLARCPA